MCVRRCVLLCCVICDTLNKQTSNVQYYTGILHRITSTERKLCLFSGRLCPLNCADSVHKRNKAVNDVTYRCITYSLSQWFSNVKDLEL